MDAHRLLFDRRSSLPALGLAALFVSSAHCGAKTGLEAPALDAAPDAAMDASDDAPTDATNDVVSPPIACRPIRYFARVGAVTNVRPDLDTPVLGAGFLWSLEARPPMSNARIFSDGTDTAVITPDVVGEYSLAVDVPTGASQGPLRCAVVIIAQPPDPRCPGYALIEPRVSEIPGSPLRIALDTSYSDPVRVFGAQGGATLAEDRAARVSVAAISRPITASGEAAAVLAAEGARAEAEALAALAALGGGADTLFVGRSSQLRSGGVARRSTLRLLANSELPLDRVRSALVEALVPGVGVIAPSGQSPARAFIIELSTVVLVSERRAIELVAVAPEGLVDDLSSITSIRMADFANSSGVGVMDERLDTRCHQVRATRTLKADFLWFVDTSGSMMDDQQRVGRTASRFFGDLTRAGVDFRVGVFQAGTDTVNLAREPGNVAGSFSWIAATATDGARQLAWRVTEESFEPGDNRRPYRMTLRAGMDEQPVGAAVMVYDELRRRTMAGESNAEWRLRPDAVQVAFLVTDEPGGPNDLGRFFDNDIARWGRDVPTQIARAAAFFRSQNVVPFGLVPDDARARCPSDENFAQCVILAAGGAFIPISVADSREADRAFTQAMTRIVDVIAGAGSEFVLPTIPISATLRARVGGTLTPRSRQDGFDYEDGSRALVFRGVRYRPMVGQDVRAAYFVWTRD
jgi:hypothetical protein